LTRGEQPEDIKRQHSKSVLYWSARPPKARGPGHLPGLSNGWCGPAYS